MLLELSRFASLMLGILSLDAVIHTAFLEPGTSLEQQLVPALRLLLVSAAVCLLSGWIFSLGKATAGKSEGRLWRTLPMQIFRWAGGVITLLFAAAWFLERYYLHVRS